MISETQIDLLIERLIDRTNKANEVFLKTIGEHIKKIKELSPTKAHQLVQILKYGGSYEEIVKKITQYSAMNIKDVDDIFAQYAKKDQNFYEKFYKYKDIPFIPYDDNYALKTQTMAMSNIVKNEMYDYLRTNVLGYTIKDDKGNLIFKGMRDTYNELLNTAAMNVSQGKETFDSAMSDLMRQIGESGLKTIDFNSTYIDKDGIERHRTMRLDSYVRMHMQSNLRELHNENQAIFGKEFGADGVEISVHEFPAPDHERVQGRQFSKQEYANLQAGLFAKDYKGRTYTLDHDGKGGYRPISELNCYHYKFDIVLGVSQPEYTDKQLNDIRQRNRDGFELYDKRSGQYRKYTMYEGTQLQRNIERKIREQKDIQILAKESDNKELLEESQRNITALTKQYKELSEKSGLPTKMDRLKVAGYKRTKITQTPVNNNIKYDVWDNDTIYISEERINLRKDALKELIDEQEQKVYADKKILDERNIDINSNERNAVHYRSDLGILEKYVNELNNYKDMGAKQIKLNSLEDCKELLSYNNIKMDIKSFKDSDFNLIKDNTKALYDLSNKYPKITKEIAKHGFDFKAEKLEDSQMAATNYFSINLNEKYYKNYDYLNNEVYDNVMAGYLTPVKKTELYKANITHEFGHMISLRMRTIYFNETSDYIKLDNWNDIILDDFMQYSTKKLDKSKEWLIDLYVSEYGKTLPEETFAELFSSLNGGVSNDLSEALGEYLEELLNNDSKKTLFFK